MKRIAVMVALLVALMPLAACSQSISAAEQQAQCFQNEKLLQTEMNLFSGDTGGMVAPFASVVAKTGVKCPSGGTYSYDPSTGIVTCSVHGHPK